MREEYRRSSLTQDEIDETIRDHALVHGAYEQMK